MMDYYKEILPYYDDLTKGYYNYRKILEELKKLIRGKKILEIGVGTGTLARSLYKEGYAITGIDTSKPMINKAKDKLKGTSIKLINKKIQDFKSKEKFDSVISHASVFVVIYSNRRFVIESYITNKNDIKKSLKNIYNLLNNKGVFILDFYPEHNPLKRFYHFENYDYEFEIKKKKNMKDFEKIHYIKSSGKILAKSKIHKIRIPLNEFKTYVKRVGFRVSKRYRKKYLILEK